MTRNQKILAACGGVGCLGIILAVILGVVVYYFYARTAPARSYNFNSNANSNRNRNSNGNSNSNQNANESTNRSSTDSPSGTSSSSYSDDEKHRLFQAASTTGDAEVVQKVVKKLGLFTAAGVPADDYPQFIKDHIAWGARSADFINSIDTPAKARAYVDSHL